MAGPFDDLIPVQSAQAPPPGGAPAQQASPALVWTESPAPADYDGKNPAFPPPYAQTVAESQRWEAAGGIAQPYARVDPHTGQTFIRTPTRQADANTAAAAPVAQGPQPPQTSGAFDDLVPPAAGGGSGNGPDFHAHSVGGYVNDGLRSIARGVPILGALADKADAASAAALAPYVEPTLDKIPGHDRGFDIGGAGSFADRYQRAYAMQRGLDTTFDQDHPAASTALKVGGGLASLVGAGLMAPGAAAPTTSLLGHGAALIPRMAAGAVDAGLFGGANGYLQGGAPLLSPDRFGEAGREGLMSAAAGAAFPLAATGAGAAWKATGQHLVDALRGNVQIGGAASDLPATTGAGVSNSDLVAAIGDTQAAREALPPLSAKPSDAEGAYDRIWRSVDRQGQSPLAVVQAIKGLGPYGMLADAGPQTRALADAVVNMPGQARDMAATALDLRQRGQLVDGEWRVRPASTRIADQAAEGMGLGGRDYHSDLDTLTAQQKADAGPLFAKAYGAGPQTSPVLESLTARPSVREAMGKAYRIAQEEGRNPEALGLVNAEDPAAWDSWAQPDAAQAVASLKAPGRDTSQGPSLLKFIADGGGMKGADGELSAMDADKWHAGKPFQRRLIGAGDTADGWALRAQEAAYFPKYGGRPTERDLLDAMSGELRGKPVYAREPDSLRAELERQFQQAQEIDHNGGLAEDVPHPDQYVGRPEPTTTPVYEGQRTPQTWHYVQQGLDDLLERYRDPLTGKLNLDGEGRAIAETRKTLRDELVRLNPDYGTALDAFAGPAALKAAAAQGQAMFREDAPTNAKALAGLTPSERDMFRIGSLQAFRSRLGNINVTYDVANRAGFLKPAQLDLFRELFPDRATYGQFANTLDREKTMFDTRAAVGGGSATARRLSDAEDTAENPLEQAGHVIAAAHGDMGSIGQIAGALFKRDSGHMSEGTANAVARILFDMDTQGLPQTAEGLAAAQKRALLAKVLKGGGAPVAASGAGAYRDQTR